jgi:hypothetical protein
MQTERTINFRIDADTIINIAEIAGNAEFFRAIGYLAQWNPSHAICEIIGGVYDGNPEIIATYRREERGPITYQIGAVWHEGKSIDGLTGEPLPGHFGFHS